MSLYILSVWLHVLLACVWVGGLIYTAAVVIPFATKHGPDERQRIIRGQARKFRIIGWSSVVLLLITGLINVMNYYRLGGIGEAFRALFRPGGNFWLRRKVEVFVLMV